MNKNSIKLTFTGDIMCDMLEISAYKNSLGHYSFLEKFSSCEKYFQESDFIVGNLETPIGDTDFCSEQYTFNSPIELALAIKKCGISLVTTANNHCLDRGVEGLNRTIELLDKINLKHTGTNLTLLLNTKQQVSLNQLMVLILVFYHIHMVQMHFTTITI